ncbi:7872_t:CDS:2 [Ambispora gerdemannii]|uniref:7872_t:CDS:1 n=1 Tax=Ambispora gerdemannii TaxID=144530 RepID=A0A9N9FNX2_9GLOM|nr:7872_t:CDS:2 [Ambispora gerdemannii]
MPMKEGTLNCVAQRVVEHFEKAKRGHGLTSTRKQKIGIWSFKYLFQFCYILYSSTSGKYRTGRFEEIEMVVHNGHTFPRNHHFPRDRMVEYYSDNAWKAINKALQGPQFVLEDGRTFRTWMKHTDIIKACKELFEDAVDWQFQEGIINEERKQESLESLKIVELAEQQFCVEHGHGGRWNAPNYQVGDVVCIDMKECYPASMRGQGECSPWFKRFGHLTHHLVRIAVNGELPQDDDITGFAQHFACQSGEGCGKTKGWTPIVLLRYLLEASILESVTIGEAIISLTKQTKLRNHRKVHTGNKVEEKRLTHRVVIDEGELDFLIQDCIKEGTYAGSDKCPLGHILTYYEGHQPQYTHLRASMLAYAHINLLEMLRRFGPNEVVRSATDSIYTKRPYIRSKMYRLSLSKLSKRLKRSAIPRFGKYYIQKTKMPLAKGEYFPCSKHKPFVCHDCFWDWYARKGFWEVTSDKKPSSNTSSKAITEVSEPLEERIREIQPGQWRDKGEKIHGPDPNVVYWPKDRHWRSVKNVPDSNAPSIHDPITRSQVSYLNGGGGSGKTTRAIRIFKDINMVVFTHTNALAKDFQNDRKVKAQTWHSFFRWNGVGEWTPERTGEKKFPRVVIWDEVCTVPRHILEKFIDYLLEQKCQVICCGDDAQPPPFFGDWLKERVDYYEEVLTDYRAKFTEKWEYLEAEWKPSDRILSAHLLSRRIASQKCLELHRKKYPNIPIPLIYRPKDGRKQNCLVQIPGSSEKRELVKNDIIHLPLNTLPDKFLKDILADKKVIDWELGYAMDYSHQSRNDP